MKSLKQRKAYVRKTEPQVDKSHNYGKYDNGTIVRLSKKLLDMYPKMKDTEYKIVTYYGPIIKYNKNDKESKAIVAKKKAEGYNIIDSGNEWIVCDTGTLIRPVNSKDEGKYLVSWTMLNPVK